MLAAAPIGRWFLCWERHLCEALADSAGPVEGHHAAFDDGARGHVGLGNVDPAAAVRDGLARFEHGAIVVR